MARNMEKKYAMENLLSKEEVDTIYFFESLSRSFFGDTPQNVYLNLNLVINCANSSSKFRSSYDKQSLDTISEIWRYFAIYMHKIEDRSFRISRQDAISIYTKLTALAKKLGKSNTTMPELLYDCVRKSKDLFVDDVNNHISDLSRVPQSKTEKTTFGTHIYTFDGQNFCFIVRTITGVGKKKFDGLNPSSIRRALLDFNDIVSIREPIAISASIINQSNCNVFDCDDVCVGLMPIDDNLLYASTDDGFTVNKISRLLDGSGSITSDVATYVPEYLALDKFCKLRDSFTEILLRYDPKPRFEGKNRKNNKGSLPIKCVIAFDSVTQADLEVSKWLGCDIVVIETERYKDKYNKSEREEPRSRSRQGKNKMIYKYEKNKFANNKSEQGEQNEI